MGSVAAAFATMPVPITQANQFGTDEAQRRLTLESSEETPTTHRGVVDVGAGEKGAHGISLGAPEWDR